MNTRISTIILMIAIAIITPLTAAESDQKSVTTIAILPFHCRAGAQHKDLATAIALISGSVIQESGRAAVVDREQVDKFFGGKALAEAELTDKAELARAGQTIGADFVVWGYYDIIDGTLIIEAELIQSLEGNSGKDPLDVDGHRRHIRVKGRTHQIMPVIERFATRLRDTLPRVSSPPAGHTDDIELDTTKAIAIFDFTPIPADKDTTDLAKALTVTLDINLKEVLPLVIMERQRIQNIPLEEKLRIAGLTRQLRVLQAGKLIGADYVLLGSLSHFGGSARLDLQVLDVTTGAMITTYGISGRYDDLLFMDRQLTISLSEKLVVDLKQVHRLRQRPVPRNTQAVFQSDRAWEIVSESYGRQEEADHLIRRSLDLDPQNPYVLHRAGLVAWELDRYDQAEEHLRRALKLQPDSAWHNQDLGRFLQQVRGNAEQALPFARRAVELAPADRHNNLLLAKCLVDLEKFEAAEPYARKASQTLGTEDLSHPDDEAERTLAKTLEELGRYAEAAYWYERSSGRNAWACETYLKKAWALYGQAAKRDGQIRVLRKLVARGFASSAERLELARSLRQENPPEAAALCYAILTDSDKQTAREARELLQQMGMPPEPPFITGPIFDINGLQKLGVQLYLQPYEGFRFPRQLDYIKAVIEDTVGIPVMLDKEPRPLVAAEYIREADEIDPKSQFSRDLRLLARDTRSVAAIGLTSVDIKGVYSRRWADKQGRAVVSTYCFEPDDRTPLTSGRIARYTLPGYMRLLMKQAALCVMPGGNIRTRQCVTKSCSLGAIAHTDLWPRELPPCPACRATLQANRKDWPVGVTHRLPIQAGPSKPAINESKRTVLLLAVGLRDKTADLEAVAQCISMSTGLNTRIEYLANTPAGLSSPWRRQWVLEYASNVLEDQGNLAAICVLSHNETQYSHARTGLPWKGSLPAKARKPSQVNCPIIFLAAKSLPDRLARSAPVSKDLRGKVQTLNAPEYAKAIVGGLAIAARKDHQCWTYGCPATVWEGIGIAHRCSYWLCPECRKAVAQYYQTSTTNNSDKQQTPVVSK